MKGELTCHVLSHTDITPFACGVCNIAHFATPGRLNAHLSKCGKPLQFPCDLCGKYFSSKQSVEVHAAEAPVLLAAKTKHGNIHYARMSSIVLKEVGISI